jgi:hypothetical protein
MKDERHATFLSLSLSLSVCVCVCIYIHICRSEEMELKRKKGITWKIPGIVFVDIDLLDEFNSDGFLLNLPVKIKPNELFISWMKPKSWQYCIFTQFLTCTTTTHHRLFSLTTHDHRSIFSFLPSLPFVGCS